MTAAQRDALKILAEVDPSPVGGWKQSNRRKPTPLINMKVAGNLCRAGYARRLFVEPAHWSPYTHDDKYEITDAGRRVLDDACNAAREVPA